VIEAPTAAPAATARRVGGRRPVPHHQRRRSSQGRRPTPSEAKRVDGDVVVIILESAPGGSLSPIRGTPSGERLPLIFIRPEKPASVALCVPSEGMVERRAHRGTAGRASEAPRSFLSIRPGSGGRRSAGLTTIRPGCHTPVLKIQHHPERLRVAAGVVEVPWSKHVFGRAATPLFTMGSAITGRACKLSPGNRPLLETSANRQVPRDSSPPVDLQMVDS
jgi:hypothetical protein